MRALVLALAVLVGGGRDRAAPHPIQTINPLIGDLSFVLAFGRLPTAADAPELRVATHLAFVEAGLRVADVDGLDADQRAARARALDHLRAYWQRGSFPASEAATGLLPSFVDHASGARCAVAYLVEQDAGDAAIRAIDADYHNAYVSEIAAPELASWAETAGLSRAELELIQPSYPPRPTYPDIEVRIATEYANAVDEDADAGALTHVGLLRGGIHLLAEHNPWIGAPIVGVDGAIGWAAGERWRYDAHATLGTQVSYWPRNGRAHWLGVTAGIGIDGLGDRIPRTWTVPIDTYYSVPWGRQDHIGVVGGIAIAVAGADRGLGWHAGIDLALHLPTHEQLFGRRVVHVGAGVERLADATFIGVSVGITAHSRAGFYAPEY